MIESIFNNFIEDISILNKLGLSYNSCHGGGPRIKRELDKSNIATKFIEGLRVTDKNIINIVENVLIEFNNDIVISLNKKALKLFRLIQKKNIIKLSLKRKNLDLLEYQIKLIIIIK